MARNQPIVVAEVALVVVVVVNGGGGGRSANGCRRPPSRARSETFQVSQFRLEALHLPRRKERTNDELAEWGTGRG